jgi:Uma2 family endonuclease
MAEPAAIHRAATYDDLCRVAPEKVAEILGGELIVNPRPGGPHAAGTSRLSQDVSPFDRKPGGPSGPGGWIILYEPELHLGGDVLVPDLAGWRRERMPAIPRSAYFTLAPDWVCESLSPGTRRIDRVVKMPIYARERVGFCWLQDPEARTVEVFRLEGPSWTLVGTWAAEGKARLPPFEAIEMEIGRWWEDVE